MLHIKSAEHLDQTSIRTSKEHKGNEPIISQTQGSAGTYIQFCNIQARQGPQKEYKGNKPLSLEPEGPQEPYPVDKPRAVKTQ